MFRNMYDTDVTVWSPEGRLLQVRKKIVYLLLVTMRSMRAFDGCASSLLVRQSSVSVLFITNIHLHPLHLLLLHHYVYLYRVVRSNMPWNQSNKDPPASPSVPPPTPSSALSNDPSPNYPLINKKYSKLMTISGLVLPVLPPMHAHLPNG